MVAEINEELIEIPKKITSSGRIQTLGAPNNAGVSRELRIVKEKNQTWFNSILGSSIINLIKTRVESSNGFSKGFRKIFSKGEKVLEMHVHSTNASEIMQILDSIEKGIPALKRMGFAGFFIDTPNYALARHIMKKFNAVEIRLPGEIEDEVRTGYMAAVREFNFPKKYASMPVKRIIKRFS